MTNIENRLVLGVLVNPFAGVGGAVGLKGSDGSDTREEALRRGAVVDYVLGVDKGVVRPKPPRGSEGRLHLVEVRTGLTGGERIAVDGAGFLTDGTNVTEAEG